MLGLFLGDDASDHLGCDRLHIGRVGQTGIGHDRRGVGVDQDDPIPLFPQRLAGLRAGIVELAGLSDDDGPGPDDEDAVDVGAFGHGRAPAAMGFAIPSQDRAGYRDCAAARKTGLVARKAEGDHLLAVPVFLVDLEQPVLDGKMKRRPIVGHSDVRLSFQRFGDQPSGLVLT